MKKKDTWGSGANATRARRRQWPCWPCRRPSAWPDFALVGGGGVVMAWSRVGWGSRGLLGAAAAIGLGGGDVVVVVVSGGERDVGDVTGDG